MFKRKKNNKGFTLVELLVVIAIIGILAVVAVPSLFKNVDKAKATQVVTNVKALKTEILTEYANAKTDSELLSTTTDSPFQEAKIKTLLDITSSTGELGEIYLVVDDTNTPKKEGEVNIQITFTDNKKAKIVATALDLTDPGEGKILSYSVGKK